MNEQKALDTIRNFFSIAHCESDRENLALRDASKALNYLENWCLKGTETPQNSTIDG